MASATGGRAGGLPLAPPALIHVNTADNSAACRWGTTGDNPNSNANGVGSPLASTPCPVPGSPLASGNGFKLQLELPVSPDSNEKMVFEVDHLHGLNGGRGAPHTGQPHHRAQPPLQLESGVKNTHKHDVEDDVESVDELDLPAQRRCIVVSASHAHRHCLDVVR